MCLHHTLTSYREMTCNMYGLGGLLRSRLYEDYHANDYDAVGGRSNKQLSSKKQTVSKAVLQQINRRDKYLTKALQVNCVYEITESKDIFNKEIEIRGISLSNYALTVLSMHIGNLSANLQKIKQLFQMTFQRSGRVATSETTFLKSKLAEDLHWSWSKVRNYMRKASDCDSIGIMRTCKYYKPSLQKKISRKRRRTPPSTFKMSWRKVGL